MFKKTWRCACMGILCIAVGSCGALGMSNQECISDIEDDVEYESRAMIMAVRTGDAEAVDELLLQGVDANTFDNQEPVIMVALRRGYWYVVRRLLEDCPKGSRVDLNLAEGSGRGMRPLHTAIACAERKDHVGVIEQLATVQTINCSDAHGLLPLDYALLRDDELGLQITKILRQKGAQFRTCDHKRRTAVPRVKRVRFASTDEQATLDAWLR